MTLYLEEAAGLAPPPNAEAAELEIIRRIERGAGTATASTAGRRAGATSRPCSPTSARARAPRGMVSQGRVAALIGAKPEERRGVLEEAAGIAGLRARRHEAELKLRQAETNLTRADDLRTQLEAQRESLRKQARQAARYRNLSGLTRAAEAEWMALLAARAEGRFFPPATRWTPPAPRRAPPRPPPRPRRAGRTPPTWPCPAPAPPRPPPAPRSNAAAWRARDWPPPRPAPAPPATPRPIASRRSRPTTRTRPPWCTTPRWRRPA